MVGCGLRAHIILRCHSFVVGLLGHLVLRMQEKLAASGYVRFLLGSGLERGTEFLGFILRLIGISRVYIRPAWPLELRKQENAWVSCREKVSVTSEELKKTDATQSPRVFEALVRRAEAMNREWAGIVGSGARRFSQG